MCFSPYLGIRSRGGVSPKGLVHNLLMLFFTLDSSKIKVFETCFYDIVITYFGCVLLGVDSLRGGLAEGNRILANSQSVNGGIFARRVPSTLPLYKCPSSSPKFILTQGSLPSRPHWTTNLPCKARCM